MTLWCVEINSINIYASLAVFKLQCHIPCDWEVDLLSQSDMFCFWQGNLTWSVFFSELHVVMIWFLSPHILSVCLLPIFSVIRDRSAPFLCFSVETLSCDARFPFSVTRVRCHLTFPWSGESSFLAAVVIPVWDTRVLLLKWCYSSESAEISLIIKCGVHLVNCTFNLL